jgi:hypothetical protein
MGKLVFQVTGAKGTGNPARPAAAETRSPMRYAHCYAGLRPFSGIGKRDVTAQLVVSDSKNTITLARSSADVSPPYGFMLLPGTTSSGFAMKRSSFSLSGRAGTIAAKADQIRHMSASSSTRDNPTSTPNVLVHQTGR